MALVAPCANILSSQATSAKLHNIALEPIIPLFLEIAQCVRQKLSQPGIWGPVEFYESESRSASLKRPRVPEQIGCGLEPGVRTTLDPAMD